MERLTTSIDQHGRMLIPSHIRERLNINPGEKVILEIDGNQIKVVNIDLVIDEMHNIFTQNNNGSVEDFINHKRSEHILEEARASKDGKDNI